MKGSVTVIVFSDVFRKTSPFLQSGEPVLVTGSIDADDESMKVIASDISLLSDWRESPHSSVHFDINASTIDANSLETLKNIISQHKGKLDGYIHLYLNGQSETVIYLGKDMRLNAADELKTAADAVLGRGSTRFT
ncbi:MAG TPA: hypothetical protein P5244_10165, partial [Syntrophales bacterium]|nr:hypothetical protein [Syntrophales bacterium]